jgi:hypothetical protein
MVFSSVVGLSKKCISGTAGLTTAKGDMTNSFPPNQGILSPWLDISGEKNKSWLLVLPASLLPLFRGWQADISHKNKLISRAFPACLPSARVFGTGGASRFSWRYGSFVRGAPIGR